jgi:hypothetical protein
MNYPKSRLNIALETAKAVREIIDVLEDQPELGARLVHLAIQDAMDASPEMPEDCTHPAQADPHFGYKTNEARDLWDEEEDVEDCAKLGFE